MFRKSFFKEFCRAAAVALLLSLIAMFAVSCGCLEIFEQDTLTKEELYENISKDQTEKATVAHHLYDWDFPQFNTNKLMYVESLVSQNFYKEMKDKLTLANSCAQLFLAYFYDNIDLENETAVTDALLKCYMKSIGDDYAAYRVPSEQEVFNGEISGGASFVGIGVQVRNTEEGLPYITAVYGESGAASAGILPKDVITSVDGRSSSEIGYQAAMDALKGEAGSFVQVGILRGDERLVLNVERKLLQETSVCYYLDAETSYGYVHIMAFQKTTGTEFKAAIDYLEAVGAKGIVFDLRNNLGGLLSAVKEVVSYLVEDGLRFLSVDGYNIEEEIDRTLADHHEVNLPIVVLVNEYTASAAEIFASALRDYRDHPELGAKNNNITIVGKKTYGKGVMQSSYSMKDGSAVTFTTAYYNPPSGVNYHGVGVYPDEGYEVDPRYTIYGDAQLSRAYEALDEFFVLAAA